MVVAVRVGRFIEEPLDPKVLGPALGGAWIVGLREDVGIWRIVYGQYQRPNTPNDGQINRI